MKIFRGRVVGVGVKTAVVEVERVFAHPMYVRRVRRSKRYHVYDEVGLKKGEQVNFVQCRPLSKTKRWKVLGPRGVKRKK